MSKVTRVQTVFDEFYKKFLGPDREEGLPYTLFHYGVNLDTGLGVFGTDIKEDPETVLEDMKWELRLCGHSDDWTDQENQELLRLIDEKWSPVLEEIQKRSDLHEWISEKFWNMVMGLEDDLNDTVFEIIDTILSEGVTNG
jgi:hypothetical protein